MDGLRGLFALVVFVSHVVQFLGSQVLFPAANFSVCAFFVLSGYVLTRGWDGRYGVFLARRFLRLWPVYVVCLAAGYWLAQTSPLWTQFFWYPILNANSKPAVDPPIWSLCIEWWAMFFMPLFVMARVNRPWGALALASGMFLLGIYQAKLNFGMFFVFGAYLSHWSFRNRFLESAAPQWLGRISYSLYLSHYLVLRTAEDHFGNAGLIASIPLAFLVGWLVSRYVERPSIALSRKVDALSRSAAARLVEA